MPGLPKTFKTTPAFCDALRRIRALTGLTLDQIVGPQEFDHPERVLDLEIPYREVDPDLVYGYDRGLDRSVGQRWAGIVAALASAHFDSGLADDLRSQVVSWQTDNSGPGAAILLGAEVGKTEFDPLVVDSCTLFPAAEASVRDDDLEGFLRAGTEIAWRRQSLTLIREIDLDNYSSMMSSLVRTWRFTEHVYSAGLDSLRSVGLVVDPIICVDGYESAWQLAAALGASEDDRAALAWALTLIKVSADNKPAGDVLEGIMRWPVLDSAGPPAYSALLDDAVRHLTPAPDLIWEASRKYLARWHGRYIRSLYDISVRRTHSPVSVRGVSGVDPEVLHQYLVTYNPDTLPGLPDVLGLVNAPSLVITPTQMRIGGNTGSYGDYWWLPSGRDAQILTRPKRRGYWRAVQFGNN